VDFSGLKPWQHAAQHTKQQQQQQMHDEPEFRAASLVQLRTDKHVYVHCMML
jgi:hypothetical protein